MRNQKGYKQQCRAAIVNTRKKELDSIKQLMAKNSYSKANSELIKYMNRYPDDMFGVFLYGRLQLNCGEIKSAKEAFHTVVRKNGSNKYSALSELGNIAVTENDLPTARMYFQKVLTESPNKEEFTVLAWAKLERRERNLEEALRILDIPSYTTNRMVLEKVKNLYLMDRIEEARKLIRTLRTDTTDPMFNRSVFLELARLEKIDGTYEKAISYINKAKSGSKDVVYIQSLYEETKLNIKYGYFDKALDSCQELMTTNHPYEDEIYLMRGIIYQGKRDIPKAVHDYQIALTSTDEETIGTASFHYGNILFAKGDFEEAEKLFLKSLVTHGEVHDAGYFKLIALYIKQNRLDEAQMLLDDLVQKFPEIRHDLSFIIAIRTIQNKRGIKIPTEPLVYIEKQIIDYNKAAALAHIRAGHTEKQPGKSVFSDKLDINTLYDYVQSKMSDDNKIHEDIMDVYSISYPNVGEVDGTIINNIRVVAIPNTKDIITMYPSEDYFLPRKCDYKKTEEVPKQMSRVDKFNKRFAQYQPKK